MVNGVRTSDPPPGLNKGPGSKFCVGSQVQQTLEEGRRTYCLERKDYRDEDSYPKTLNDKDVSIHIYIYTIYKNTHIYIYIYNIVQLEGNSNLVKLSLLIYFAREYYYTLRLVR